MRSRFGGLAILVTALMVESAWGQASPSAVDILPTLRAGGYVIVFRHGSTNPDQADTDPLHDDNIAKQRHLNDKGRSDAKEVGAIFKAAGVPIGKSYSSRFYRALETARLIGGKEPQATLDVTEGGLVVSPNENNRRMQALRAIVSSPPDPGHQHPGRDSQAEHPRRARQGLVRGQGRRGIDLQARRKRQVRVDRTHPD
jgi:broad specificity phosphatase PhoE